MFAKLKKLNQTQKFLKFCKDFLKKMAKIEAKR